MNLRRGARLLTQAYDDALRPSGLKITQFTLLAAIERFGHTTLQSLADFMGMDRTTLTRNLALLERDGLVELDRGTEDRREQWIALSPLGGARRYTTPCTPWENFPGRSSRYSPSVLPPPRTSWPSICCGREPVQARPPV